MQVATEISHLSKRARKRE